MSRIVARLIILLIAVLNTTTALGEGRFDPVSGGVVFDCVSIAEDPSRIRGYVMTLEPEADGTFSVLESREVFRAGECDSTFSAVGDLLTGEVRVVDAIYDVVLAFDPSRDRFSVQSVKFNRLSDTALWVVSNGIHEVYLGGTIHILQDADYPLPALFSAAYEAADLVAFEVDPSLPVTSEDRELFNLPIGESVLEYMSPSVELVLDDFFKKFDRTLEDYARRRPEFFNSVLYFFGAQSFGFGTGVDDFFAELARQDGKPTDGLETFSEQVNAIIDGYRDIALNWNLTYLLRLAYIQSGQIESDLRDLIQQWREGRMDLITASNEAYQRSSPQQYEHILAKRNRNWIPVIESYLETPETELVLGGFAHFAGPDNVLTLLEDLGYSVEKYTPTGSPFGDLDAGVEIIVELF